MWAFWISWSDCSERCDEGIRTRNRICLNGELGDEGCEGKDYDEENCIGNVRALYMLFSSDTTRQISWPRRYLDC